MKSDWSDLKVCSPELRMLFRPVINLLPEWSYCNWTDPFTRERDNSYEAAGLSTWLFFVGIVVFRLMSLVKTPPSVSIPRDSGVTSNSSTSVTSPAKTPPWMAAPMATASSGLTDLLGARPNRSWTVCWTYRDKHWVLLLVIHKSITTIIQLMMDYCCMKKQSLILFCTAIIHVKRLHNAKQ